MVLCAARSNLGIPELKATIYDVITKKKTPKPKIIYYDDELEKVVAMVLPKLDVNCGDINKGGWLLD